MIIVAEQYANMITAQILNTHIHNKPVHDKLGILLQRVLINSYLLELLTTKVKVVNGQRKVNLLSDNSMKTYRSNSNKLCKILQRFASDHEYIDNFPSHRAEAIGYFQNAKKMRYTLSHVRFKKLR